MSTCNLIQTVSQESLGVYLGTWNSESESITFVHILYANSVLRSHGVRNIRMCKVIYHSKISAALLSIFPPNQKVFCLVMVELAFE